MYILYFINSYAFIFHYLFPFFSFLFSLLIYLSSFLYLSLLFFHHKLFLSLNAYMLFYLNLPRSQLKITKTGNIANPHDPKDFKFSTEQHYRVRHSSSYYLMLYYSFNKKNF